MLALTVCRTIHRTVPSCEQFCPVRSMSGPVTGPTETNMFYFFSDPAMNTSTYHRQTPPMDTGYDLEASGRPSTGLFSGRSYCMNTSTRSTTTAVKPRPRANSVKERRSGLKRQKEAEQQEEVKSKLVINVAKLLLEVSLCPLVSLLCMLTEITHSYRGYCNTRSNIRCTRVDIEDKQNVRGLFKEFSLVGN
jgi:hypothetical protein